MRKQSKGKKPSTRGKKVKSAPKPFLLKKLAYASIALVVLITGTAIWYVNQDRPTQERAEALALNFLEHFRDGENTPEDLQHCLDWVADKIPLSRGNLVDVTKSPFRDSFAFGGLPRGHRLKLLKNTGYIVGYDENTKNPAWVAYRIEWHQNFKRAKRPAKFRLDSRTVAQIKHEDYTGTGFDRGHMAPNYGIAMTAGIKAQIETFLLSNIAPQSPNNNRKIWKRLEMRVAKRLSRRFKEIWVITGPIYYNETPRRLPPAQIAVPDAFYKILIDEYEPNKIRAIAFIIPQEVSGNEPLKPYLTNINRIEELTGLTFFPRLTPTAQKELKESAHPFVW